MAVPARRQDKPTKQSGDGTTSASGAVSSNMSGDWWTEAETSLFTQWANSFSNYKDSFINPYFDYFFTGQDVQITIDGLESNDDILPIYSFAYNIQQQKQPLYGFWSYTYDAMLRGTRIVTGAFSIIATEPYLLTGKIAKAAQVRATATAANQVGNMHAIRGLDEDEALIDSFWRRNYDTNLQDGQQHLFSIHPPFNFVIRYGLQDTSSVHQSPSFRASEIRQAYNNSDPMFLDYNERLIKNPVSQLDMQVLLENVELMSKQIEYDTEGTPLIETYTFMARDERLLKPIDKSNPVYSSPPPDPTEAITVSKPKPSSGTGGGGRMTVR